MTPPSNSRAQLSAIVVHWRNEAQMARLLDAWPDDPHWQLLVVDNSRSLEALPTPATLLVPDRNLGFGAGVDFGAARATGDWLLVLNPDARPEPGALDALRAAIRDFPEAAGIVPALVDPEGRSQHLWQLRPLPTPAQLVAQTFRFVAVHGPREPPPQGTTIEQPAAAALLLRRETLDAVGGFDGGYYPAWFEDVDLARRLADAARRDRASDQAGECHSRGRLVYEPGARFVHEGGTSVPALGYGPFLWIYYRHLARYLHRHHSSMWALLARGALVIGMLLRVLALPLRSPRLATGRGAAARALLASTWGALSNWQGPRQLRNRYPEAPMPPIPKSTKR